MPSSLSFIILGDSNAGSANKRSHWRAKAKLVEEWRLRTRSAMNAQIAEPWFAQRVRITFTLYRGRALDPDNAAGSLCLKAAVDEMRGKFFPDDSHKHVEYGPIRQVTGKQYAGQPAVEVTLETIE